MEVAKAAKTYLSLKEMSTAVAVVEVLMAGQVEARWPIWKFNWSKMKKLRTGRPRSRSKKSRSKERRTSGSAKTWTAHLRNYPSSTWASVLGADTYPVKKSAKHACCLKASTETDPRHKFKSVSKKKTAVLR